jgi:hypothetical protein
MILLASLALAVQVLAVPIPMEIARERINARSIPVAMWNISVSGAAGDVVTREQILMAMAEWCRANRAPMPLLLTKEQAWPIITRKAGGRWKLIHRLISYAGTGAALAGMPIGAAAGPTMELLTQRAGDHIPDVSALALEVPAVIMLPATGGVTICVWSAKMRHAPQIVGPLEVQTK